MIIQVRVIPNSKENKVVQENDKFKIYINSPAQDGKANKALIEILSDHLNTKKSQITIIKGNKSRDKTIKIL